MKALPCMVSGGLGHAESIPFNVVSGRTACGGPLDPWTFLTRLDCIAAEPERTFQLFTNGGLVSVRARRAGTRTMTHRLNERPGDKRVETVVEGVRIQLLPAPGEPDPSVFGLSGGLELLVEPVSGALVSVEGKRDDIPGIIRFTLTGLSRTAAPRPDIPWPSEARDTPRVP